MPIAGEYDSADAKSPGYAAVFAARAQMAW